MTDNCAEVLAEIDRTLWQMGSDLTTAKEAADTLYEGERLWAALERIERSLGDAWYVVKVMAGTVGVGVEKGP